MTASPLVSVVIPAYNAARTLDETLRSVRSQTYRALEILVVDDGSTDETVAVASRHAAVDVRLTLIAQSNAGVAAARNEGWRRARGDFIAFVDADDLWAPRKIELQLDALEAGGPAVGLVYCWYALIDSRGHVIAVPPGVRHEGDVLARLFERNFVGNGSAVLVRRDVLVQTRGFESALRAQGAEGCEDIVFYRRVAERRRFAVVPDHLVGYRQLPDNMSSNRPRMLRSWLLAAREMLARHPDKRDALDRGVRGYGGWLVTQALSVGRVRQFPALMMYLFRYRPAIAMKVLARDVPRAFVNRLGDRARRAVRKQPTSVATSRGARFEIGAPD
jgi:glycosyltransferase involved in cell wall biosynthesis